MAKRQNPNKTHSNRSITSKPASACNSSNQSINAQHKAINTIHIQRLLALIEGQHSCKSIQKYLEEYTPNLSKDHSLLKAAINYTKNSPLDTLCSRHTVFFGFHTRTWYKRQKLITLLIEHGVDPALNNKSLINTINTNSSEYEQELEAYKETVNLLRR